MHLPGGKFGGFLNSFQMIIVSKPTIKETSRKSISKNLFVEIQLTE
jgi:hypothetical protein